MNKISYYYKYDFVSPEPIFAEVKEELKSYFQTGVIDDTLFTRYTEDCLKRLGRSSYKIVDNVFRIEDYEFKLPDDFEYVRELWLITSHERGYRMPNYCYEQATVNITPLRDRCNPGEFCAPQEIKVTYKHIDTVIQKFQCQYLLKPGNVNAKSKCSEDSFNRYSNALDSFDIRGNKLITNFNEGFVYMVYYVKEYDSNDYQLVPDNIRIKDYLKAYLMYKCFENIYNNISDETFNQVQNKFQYYENKMNEAKVIAETEIKKQTIEQQITSTLAARRRLNKYIIT